MGGHRPGELRQRSAAGLTAVALVLAAQLVWAGETVLVVDVSDAMAADCTEDTSLLDRAKSQIQQHLADMPDDERVGLVFYAARASILSMPTADHGSVARLVDGLRAVPETAAPLEALATAGRVLRERRSEDGGRILVVTSGQLDSPGPLLAAVAALRESGVAVEVAPLDPGTDGGGWRDLGVQVRAGLCSVAPSQPSELAAVEEKVRRTVAEELGVPLDSLSRDTDLVRDLGADRAVAFEVLARICDQHGVAVPESGDITNLGAIVEHVGHSGADGIRLRGPGSAYVQTVFYGTNRSPRASADPRRMYTGERSRAGRLRYGTCEVSIPLRVHKPGALETPFLSLEYLADERQHILLKTVTPMDRETFFRNLSEKLGPTGEGDPQGGEALVFVPGFNTTFEDVARRTAQMSYDLGFSGAPIMFSWPSDGSLLGYLADREDIEWSIPHIDLFLTEILAEAGARRVHLVAHSMGNEGLLRALTMMALRRDPSAEPLFENVILAAPDFDAQIFVEQTAPRVRGLSRRWTVYVSDKDGALNVSSRIRSAKRLGLPITLAEGVDTVDATGIEVTPWSVPEFHSYYATKQLVIADLIGVLHGLDPGGRELRALVQGGLPYWSFGEVAR
ncbi:MAG: alpha/beta hydrolase [Myxococcota bacterium]